MVILVYLKVRLARALLDAGAPMNSQTKDLILQNVVVQAGGQTPLHLAARALGTQMNPKMGVMYPILSLLSSRLREDEPISPFRIHLGPLRFW